MSKKISLSNQLANKLRQDIYKGKYTPGHMIPPERELCANYKLSRTTVRCAIQSLVNEGVLERVPGSGTYVGKSRQVKVQMTALGLIVPTLANPYFGELADAIEQEANVRGYEILVGQSEYTNSSEAKYLKNYAENLSVKGVLVVPNVEELPIATYRYLDENKTPFVFVARSADEIDADAVAVDGTRGAKEIVRWLIGLGHTRIAYIEGKPHLPDLRLRGYKQALKQAGIEIDSNLILVQNSRAEEAGSEGIKLLLQREIPFTAVFARNDVTAMGVLRGLDEMGVRVPADVSVAGFDNIQSSALIQPPLTTVDHTVREIGRMAVSLLLDRIEGRYGGAPRQVTLRPRLVVRSSCAAPNQKWYADWALGRKEAKSNSR